MSERDEDFSAVERRALELWQVPDAPDDFGAGVLSRLESERATPRVRRQVAAAALALVLVGGFFASRLLSDGTTTFGTMHGVSGDGGSEASPISDGVRS